jgi:hypothetical protein
MITAAADPMMTALVLGFFGGCGAGDHVGIGGVVLLMVPPRHRFGCTHHAPGGMVPNSGAYEGQWWLWWPKERACSRSAAAAASQPTYRAIRLETAPAPS